MRFRCVLAACFGLSLMIVPGAAQTLSDSPKSRASQSSDDVMPADGSVTPEMWLYMQATKRHDSPKEGVQRKAQLRSAQRQQRLESQRWFGFTNLRPTASPVPFYGSYSPMWAGSARDPFLWYGSGQPYVTYHTSVRGGTDQRVD